jgi:hypothetical protein
MNDDPIDLDGHRSSAGKIATDNRRHALHKFEAERMALLRREEELETQLLATPAETWIEVAAKAQYLIREYATTPDSDDDRRKKLIDRALGDLARLIDRDIS